MLPQTKFSSAHAPTIGPIRNRIYFHSEEGPHGAQIRRHTSPGAIRESRRAARQNPPISFQGEAVAAEAAISAAASGEARAGKENAAPAQVRSATLSRFREAEGQDRAHYRWRLWYRPLYRRAVRARGRRCRHHLPPRRAE